MAEFEVSIAHGHRSPVEESRRGGDFFCQAAPTRAAPTVLLGVAASKSLSSDFLSTALQLMFHRMVGVVDTPAEILERLNIELLRCTGSVTPSEQCGAAFAVTVDRRAATIMFAAAGTEAALLARRNGSHEHLSGTGPFLGLERYASYENCVLPFGPGDTILAYTEGVTEAQSATSQELFGTSRIIHCLRRSQRSRESPCAALVNELDTFTGSCYRNDITIATIEACITLPIGELGACLPAVPARTCVAELNTSDGARKAPSGALTAT